MVTKIKDEFNMFSAVWKYYKAMLPVQCNADDEYWGKVVEEADEVCKKYPTKLCRAFMMTILSEMERKAKIL